MKNIMMLAAFVMMSAFAMAQDAPIAPPDAPVLAPPAPAVVDSLPKEIEINPPSGKYLCAYCGLRMEIPGKCEKHQFTLVEEGLYYCANPTCDGVTAKTQGKCPKCEKDMILMEPKQE